MTFRGWREDALEFYEGLEADNSKTYWQQNKSVFEEQVRGPMEALLAELAREFGEGKIFRPYRDIRFSADKSLYKTHMGATLPKGGYVQLSAQGLGAGSGMYVMASDQLERFRRAVDDGRTGKRIEGIVGTLRASGMEVSAHDELKTAPKGYPKDHPRIELLRLKGLISWKQWPAGAWLGTAKAKDRLVELFRASKPLNNWLTKYVGPTTQPGR
ncbi:MAG: DUF2461 domain-containing protein [Actinomycetota bacterium]